MFVLFFFFQKFITIRLFNTGRIFCVDLWLQTAIKPFRYSTGFICSKVGQGTKGLVAKFGEEFDVGASLNKGWYGLKIQNPNCTIEGATWRSYKMYDGTHSSRVKKHWGEVVTNFIL